MAKSDAIATPYQGGPASRSISFQRVVLLHVSPRLKETLVNDTSP